MPPGTLRLIAGLSITLSPIRNLCEGIVGTSNRALTLILTKKLYGLPPGPETLI
jgi:hypothetical protein